MLVNLVLTQTVKITHIDMTIITNILLVTIAMMQIAILAERNKELNL